MLGRLRALSNTKFAIIITALSAVYFCLFYRHIHAYPFYIAWDMDLTTMIDSLLINSHKMPVHLAHPSFGMMLLLHWASIYGREFLHLSATNLSDLQQAYNPLLLVAQFTDYLRSFSAWATLGIALSLSFCLRRLLLLNNISVIIVFFCLLNLQVYTTQLPLMRSELYAVFIWAVACWCVSLIFTKHNQWRQSAIILCAGLLIGVSFFTKVQASFYILTIPMILFSRADTVKHQNNTSFFLALLNLCFFLSLSFAAAMISTKTMHSNTASFRSSFGITPIWCLILGACGVSLILTCLDNSWLKPLKSYNRVIIVLTTGFFSSLLLSIFLFNGNVFLAARYAVYIFKIAVMGKLATWIVDSSGVHHITDLNYAFNSFKIIKYLYIFNFLSLLINLYAYFRQQQAQKQKSPQYTTELLLTIGLFIICVLQLLFGARYHYPDLARECIWLVILPIFLLLLQTFIILRYRLLRFWRFFWLTLVWLIIIFCNFNDFYYTAIVDMTRFHYLHAPYQRNQLAYESIMDKAYPRGQRDYIVAAIQQAEQHKTLANMMDTMLKATPPLNLQQIGFVEQHAIFKLTPRETISAYSMSLKHALVLHFAKALSLSQARQVAYHLSNLNSYKLHFYPAYPQLLKLVGKKFKLHYIVTHDKHGVEHRYTLVTLTLAGKMYLLKHPELFKQAILVLEPYYYTAHYDDTDFQRHGQQWGN